jgi:3-dehydroquinate dehydratase-1
MSAPRGLKIPAGALVGVIASADEMDLARRMRTPPDFFELRLDHLPHVQASQLSKLRRPVIITARHPAEGGKQLRVNRANLLRKFLPHAAFIDVELRSLRELQAVWAEACRLRVHRICSLHDFRRTPDRAVLNKKFTCARQSGADVFKLVCRADNPLDLLTLFEFLEIGLSAMRLCVMATGRFGPISRLLFRERGSSFIYAPLRHVLYDGQLSLGQLRRQRDF